MQMNFFRRAGALLGLALLTALNASYAIAQPPNAAIVAADRMGEPWWAERHNAILETLKSHPDPQVVLIGDSILNNYDKAKPPDENFKPTWDEFYAPRAALNLGFSGDTTANVLWRLNHGEVDGIHPRVAVLLIGTNNTGWKGQTAEQTELGVDAVIANLESHLPETKILLLGILPSAVSPQKTEADRQVNAYLATCYGENPRVKYLDIGPVFSKDGQLNTAVFYDARLAPARPPLHPDTVGQRWMAEAMEPTLAKLLGEAPRVPLEKMTDINTALIPVDRLEQDSYDWYGRHHAELAARASLAAHADFSPRVVMIGDSITHFWGGAPLGLIQNGPQSWARVFGKMPVLNLGFGWDRTQNVLWRLRQGEFDGLHPEWVVLNIGTNNLTGTVNSRASTPLEVADAIAAIVGEVRVRSPQSKVILMAIFPRGNRADSPQRGPIEETNRILAARYGAGGRDAGVMYLDIGAKFLQPDGSMPRELMPDGTHPSEQGYGMWADALIAVGVKH